MKKGHEQEEKGLHVEERCGGIKKWAGGMKEEMEIWKRWLGYERDVVRDSEGYKELKTNG